MTFFTCKLKEFKLLLGQLVDGELESLMISTFSCQNSHVNTGIVVVHKIQGSAANDRCNQEL